MSLKILYMFVDPTADSNSHRAVIETPIVRMTINGVSSFEEAIKLAEQAVIEGADLIELCGGFGYAGAKSVHDAVGGRVPVGMIVHQEGNSPQLAEYGVKVSKVLAEHS
jgi:hypothetical protein